MLYYMTHRPGYVGGINLYRVNDTYNVTADVVMKESRLMRNKFADESLIYVAM